MGKEFYKPGDNWVICDRCAFKRRASEVAKEWTGLIVCRDTCLENRHPQDFVRAVKDTPKVDISRPEKPDTFVDVTYDEDVLAQPHQTVPTGTFNNGLD